MSQLILQPFRCLPTSQFILQPFFRFSYVTSSAHSPTFSSLHLCHNSFSNPSVALPSSKLILQPFCCFTFTVHSPTPSFASSTSQALHLIHLANHPCTFLSSYEIVSLSQVHLISLPSEDCIFFVVFHHLPNLSVWISYKVLLYWQLELVSENFFRNLHLVTAQDFHFCMCALYKYKCSCNE